MTQAERKVLDGRQSIRTMLFFSMICWMFSTASVKTENSSPKALLAFPRKCLHLMIARPHLRTSSCSAFSSPTVTDTIAFLSIASAMPRYTHSVLDALEQDFGVQDC